MPAGRVVRRDELVEVPLTEGLRRQAEEDRVRRPVRAAGGASPHTSPMEQRKLSAGKSRRRDYEPRGEDYLNEAVRTRLESGVLYVELVTRGDPVMSGRAALVLPAP